MADAVLQGRLGECVTFERRVLSTAGRFGTNRIGLAVANQLAESVAQRRVADQAYLAEINELLEKLPRTTRLAVELQMHRDMSPILAGHVLALRKLVAG